jgi:hypothetical protein
MFNKKKNDNEVKLSDFSGGLSALSEETLTNAVGIFKDFLAKLENELEYRKQNQEDQKEPEEKYVGKYFRRLDEGNSNDKEGYSVLRGMHVLERTKEGNYTVEYIEETYRKNKYGYSSYFSGSYGDLWTAGGVEDPEWKEITQEEFNKMRGRINDRLYIF